MLRTPKRRNQNNHTLPEIAIETNEDIARRPCDQVKSCGRNNILSTATGELTLSPRREVRIKLF
jgi:hypothetical protein